jgi:hypothetical protein
MADDADALLEQVHSDLHCLHPGECKRAPPLLFGDDTGQGLWNPAPKRSGIDGVDRDIAQSDVCIELLHGQQSLLDRTMRHLPRRHRGSNCSE